MKYSVLLDNRQFLWHYNFQYPPQFVVRYNQITRSANKIYKKYPFVEIHSYDLNWRKLKKIKRHVRKQKRKLEIWNQVYIKGK